MRKQFVEYYDFAEDHYKQLHELLKRFQLHEHQQMNDDVVSHHSDK